MKIRFGKILFWSAVGSSIFLSLYFAWQKNFFLAISFPSGAAALFILYLITNSSFVKKYYNGSFGDTLLGLGGFVFFTTSLGTLYFYNYLIFFEYDFVAHIIIPASFVVMGSMLYEILRIRRGIPGEIEVILVSAFPVLFLSFFWEFFQMKGDVWWGTQMFFDSNQHIVVDVASDLVADLFGVFIGSVLVFKNWEKWNKKWLRGNINEFK